MLVQTLYSLKIDSCYVSETCVHDECVVMHLKMPRTNSALSYFTLCVSGDPEVMIPGIGGARTALSSMAKHALLERLPVSSRLCTIRYSAQ
ncbi:hypothetical protein CLF_112172 [Clonorchis sinensis]|uniref:Uncharacterized protein n=1 Tax=Clonorchis sinensis TaxID=79923 RepID=G7YMC0_CLOSI|nr:hypothetical protein CLF_112172 [Clonorchis sinensis]